jgi:hypothetical protein
MTLSTSVASWIYLQAADWYDIEYTPRLLVSRTSRLRPLGIHNYTQGIPVGYEIFVAHLHCYHVLDLSSGAMDRLSDPLRLEKTDGTDEQQAIIYPWVAQPSCNPMQFWADRY